MRCIVSRWVGYPAGDAGLLRLAELYAMRARVRMRCLLIHGVSGAGKSMLLEKFQRDHATQGAKGAGRRTIIATQMRPVPVMRSLYGEMIRALNGNLRPTARFYEARDRADRYVDACRTENVDHRRNSASPFLQRPRAACGPERDQVLSPRALMRLFMSCGSNHRLRAAAQALTLRSRSVGIEALHYAGARLPAIISQRA